MIIPDENNHVHVRKLLNQLYDAPISVKSGFDSVPSFCGNPADYTWKYVGKKEMLIPFSVGKDASQSPLAEFRPARLERHHVWVVEGTLNHGESNLLRLRRFYLDEHSWLILFGEGYNHAGDLITCYMLYSDILSRATNRSGWHAMP